MVRKGWSTLDVPSGWVQIVRGPRPKSEKWPLAKPAGSGSSPKGAVGRWRSQGGRQGVPATRAPDPEMVQDAANQRVVKLEAALRAMGDYDGPEVASLKSSLQKAREAARSKPLQEQIAETEAFISRAQKRLSPMEEERVREQQLLDKALLRQERLRRDLEVERKKRVTPENQPIQPPPDWGAQIDCFVGAAGQAAPSRARFVRSDGDSTAQCSRGGESCQEVPPGRFCPRLRRGVGGMDELSTTGNARRSGFWQGNGGHQIGRGVGGRRSADATVDTTPIHSHEHGPLSVRCHRSHWRNARYALRGVRVGEADNPGPRRQNRHRSASSSETQPIGRTG